MHQLAHRIPSAKTARNSSGKADAPSSENSAFLHTRFRGARLTHRPRYPLPRRDQPRIIAGKKFVSRLTLRASLVPSLTPWRLGRFCDSGQALSGLPPPLLPLRKWYSGGDLNPYAFRHTPLKRTCLPIPPPEHFFKRNALSSRRAEGCKSLLLPDVKIFRFSQRASSGGDDDTSVGVAAFRRTLPRPISVRLRTGRSSSSARSLTG